MCLNCPFYFRTIFNMKSRLYIHLTDFCNQECGFCFAKRSNTKNVKKQISEKNLRLILKKVKNRSDVRLYLLGGEPTLHSDFSKTISLVMEQHLYVNLYTNGIFPLRILKILEKFGPRIRLIYNLSTPGFFFNKKIREKVISNVNQSALFCPVTLSFVSYFLDDSLISVVKLVPENTLKLVDVKLCMMVPTEGEKNPCTVDEFPKMGKNICKIIEYFEKNRPPKKYRFNKMFRRCMFSKRQSAFLQRLGLDFITKTSSCHQDKTMRDLFHVFSDLSTFKCYPLSERNRRLLNDRSNVSLINKNFLGMEKRLEKQYVLDACRKCPFFGFGKNQCSGPCLGFRINSFLNQ